MKLSEVQAHFNPLLAEAEKLSKGDVNPNTTQEAAKIRVQLTELNWGQQVIRLCHCGKASPIEVIQANQEYPEVRTLANRIETVVKGLDAKFPTNATSSNNVSLVAGGGAVAAGAFGLGATGYVAAMGISAGYSKVAATISALNVTSLLPAVNVTNIGAAITGSMTATTLGVSLGLCAVTYVGAYIYYAKYYANQPKPKQG